MFYDLVLIWFCVFVFLLFEDGLSPGELCGVLIWSALG